MLEHLSWRVEEGILHCFDGFPRTTGEESRREKKRKSETEERGKKDGKAKRNREERGNGRKEGERKRRERESEEEVRVKIQPRKSQVAAETPTAIQSRRRWVVP